MILCEIDGRDVAADRVFTHWTGWRKPGHECVRYRIAAPFFDVIDAFGSYWHDEIDRESDPACDDGTQLVGVGAELRDAKYPCLVDMLRVHGDLFGRYVLRYLQSEFTGFLVGGVDRCNPHVEFEYFLLTLDNLVVEKDVVFVEGDAVKWYSKSNCT